MKKDGYRRVIDNSMKWLGDTNTENKVIRINKAKHHKLAMKQTKRKAELLDTLIHEEYHAKHPGALEKTVYRKTPKIVKKLSTKQKQKLYSRFR